MTHITDGPAAGQSFKLMRNPIFLRVCLTETCDQWYVMDLVDDLGLGSDQVFVYRLVEKLGTVKLSTEKGSAIYHCANYKYFCSEPNGMDFINNSIWQNWCIEQAQNLK